MSIARLLALDRANSSADATRMPPTATTAAAMAMIHGAPICSATAAATSEQVMAPMIIDTLGANSKSTRAAWISGGISASALRVSISFRMSM